MSRARATARVTSSEPTELTLPERSPESDTGLSAGEVQAQGARAAVQLVVRAVATRAIALIGTVVLARVLSPSDFGLFAVVTAAVLLLALIGDAGVGGAIVQQPHAPTERELGTALAIQLVFWSAMLLAALVGSVVVPLIVPNVPTAALVVARLFAFAVWLNGLRAVPVVILTRDLRFGPYAATEVLQQIVYYGVAVALAALGYGVVSFGIGAVAQSFVGTAGLWLAVRRAPHVVFDRAIARRLLGFGVGYQLAYVLHWARESVIAIFGGLAGGLRAIGLIQFAWRNGGFALTVEEIVARVAFPAFSRLQSSASIGGAATRAVEVSFLAVAVIQAWLLATAPSLVPAVFSDQWTPAVPAFQLVCAGALAWAPVLILRSLVYSSGDSRQGLMLAAVSLVIMYVAFPVLLLLLGIVGAGLAYAVGNVLALGLYVRATSAVFTFPWRSLVRITSEVGAAAIVAAIIAMMIPGLPGLAASGVAYLAIVALLLFVFEPSLVATLRALLRARPRAAAEQASR